MWTFTTLAKISVFLVFLLALTSGKDDTEIEIVEIEIEIDEDTTDETATAITDIVTEPEETTDGPTEPSTTGESPVWEDYQTRVNIFNKTAEEFASNNEQLFKRSVAHYAEQYCNNTAGAVCDVASMELKIPEFNINAVNAEYNFDSDDVIIERRVQVGSDLQIGYFLLLANNTMLPRNILDTVTETYADEIAEDAGISFDLIRQPTTTPPTTQEPEATPTPGGGLEPWEIALIVLGSVAGAAIIIGAVYYFVFKKKNTHSSWGELDYESTSIRLYDQERPAHTYESLAKNRQSIPPDSNTGASTTFNNAAYENSAYDMTETDNRR